MSVVSPQCPITTRDRSTPSSAKIRCCSSPRRVAAWVCVEIGTPVWRCACATARSTRSTPGVTPGSSVAHLRIAALMPVPAMPSVMSRDEHVGHGLRAVEQRSRAAEVEVHRHVVVGVDAGGDDDVDVGGRGDAGDAGDVAAEPDHRQVDDAVHAAGLELAQAGDGVGLALGLVAPDLGIVVDDLGGQHEDVLVHQRHAEVGGVDRSSRGIQLRHVRRCYRCRQRADRDQRKQLDNPRSARRSRRPTATGSATAPRRPGSARPRWCRR